MAKSTSTAETETLREKLLNAALAEFGDKGFSGARVDEIATSAEIIDALEEKSE
jgi:AcrR family transcriptional regulator